MSSPRQETVFYMGAQDLGWVRRAGRPLFISYSVIRRRLRREDGTPRKRVGPLPVAEVPCAGDSRGFVELAKHGRWTVPPEEYAADMALVCREVGQFDFVIPQDWMCEDFMLAKTGVHEPGSAWPDRRAAIRAHQRRTLESYLRLRDLAPDVRWALAFQGFFENEYLEHLDDYERAGVDVRAAPRVAVGSMCKRQDTVEAARILRRLARYGCKVHALGYKTAGLPQIFGDVLTDPEAAWSADSFAWSDIARTRWYIHRGCQHGEHEHRPRLGRTEYGNCANCLTWALWWADDVERAARGLPREPEPGRAHAVKRRRSRAQLNLFENPEAGCA